MGEVKNLTSYELVDTLVASRDRDGKELERAIPTWESTELRQRALEAGMPIADQQGMHELVYLITDAITSWTEDLSGGWKQSSEKRDAMEKARNDALAFTRKKAAENKFTGWACQTEANRLLDSPGEELEASEEFAQAKAFYAQKRNEYILEYGTVHSHLFVRQEQLQKILDEFMKSRELPTVILEFRESGATVPAYGRGAAIIALNNTDLLGRTRAPIIVSLVAGQLTVSHHDMQIVRSLLDRVDAGEAAPPGKELTEAQIANIMETYRKKTGSFLAKELLDRVASFRTEVLSPAEISRADSLARSLNSTRNMTTVTSHRSKDIRRVEEQMRTLNEVSDDEFWNFILRLYLNTDDLPKIMFGGSLTELSEEVPAKLAMDGLRKTALRWREQRQKASAGEAVESPNELTADARYELNTLIEQRIQTLKELQKKAQKEYLQNLHARESVVLSADAYSLSVSRMSKILKYSGPRPRRTTGMEDSCVHHDHSTYLDVHGL